MSARPNPPRWAETLLLGLLPAREQETISGDLLEEYREAALPSRGRLRAAAWYWRQALSFANAAGLFRLLTRIAHARPAQACFVALLLAAVLPLTLGHHAAPLAAGAPVEVRGTIVQMMYRTQDIRLTVQVPALSGSHKYTFSAARRSIPRTAILPGDQVIVTGATTAGEALRADRIVTTDGRELFDRAVALRSR